MGIFKRKLKDGFNYYIQYYVNGKRYKETIGRDYNTAKKVLADRKERIRKGRFSEIIQERQKILFEDMAEEYLKTYSIPNKKSWGDDENLIKKLLKFFGGKYLNEITPYLINQYKAQRVQQFKRKQVETKSDRPISPATVNRELNCLKGIFTQAIEWEKFKGDNPVKKIKLFKEDNEIVRWLTNEEIAELLKYCSEGIKPIVVCALNTGMRLGEILNLKWKDIDWRNKLIRVEHTKNNRTRFIPMTEEMENTLISILKTPDCSFIFNHNGQRYKWVNKTFHRALNQAGIKDFRFHDLRHTFASHLAMKGVSLTAIKELLGHQSIDMTMRYAHLSKENLRTAVSLLDFDLPKIAPQTAPKEESTEVDFAKEPIEQKPTVGFEPTTYGLRNRCSTN